MFACTPVILDGPAQCSCVGDLVGINTVLDVLCNGFYCVVDVDAKVRVEDYVATLLRIVDATVHIGAASSIRIQATRVLCTYCTTNLISQYHNCLM
jgi:hypothetical protein